MSCCTAATSSRSAIRSRPAMNGSAKWSRSAGVCPGSAPATGWSANAWCGCRTGCIISASRSTAPTANTSPCVPEWLHKLPDTVSDATGSMIEPFTCGYFAIRNIGGTDASQTVAISGGGTIGLVTAAAAIGMRARVIVIDPIAHRREAALKLGRGGGDRPAGGGPGRACRGTHRRRARRSRGRGVGARQFARQRLRSRAPGRACGDGRHQYRPPASRPISATSRCAT